MKLKVISFNVAGVNYEWFTQRKEVVLSSLRKLSPDILCLQESAIIHHKNYDQAEDLARELSLPFLSYTAYGRKDEHPPNERDGIAILSRFPLTRVYNFKLPSSSSRDDTERCMQLAQIDVNGRVISIINTHLSWPMDDIQLRLEQCKAILNISSTVSKTPMLVVGDLNASKDEAGIALLYEKYHDALEEGLTWSHQNILTKRYSRDEGKIDYILYDSHFLLVDSELVLNEPTPIFPSDHFGIQAILDLC